MLRYPNGDFHRFQVRSLVGLIPIYAIDVLADAELDQFPYFLRNVDWFIKNRPDLVGEAVFAAHEHGSARHVLSIVDRHQLSRLMERVWEEGEFLSDYGIRSLSKAHEHDPFVFGDAQVGYELAEAIVKIKGGNSNWLGPIWFPTSFLIIESLLKFHRAYGDEQKVHWKSKGRDLTMEEAAQEIGNRMIGIFARNNEGRWPVYGGTEKFQSDPHWKDLLLFYEYFHGDNGAGLGASHQTGWSGLVANLIDMFRQ